MLRRTESMNVDDGVSVEPMPITAGQRVKVKYHGILSNSGSGGVYLHMGFGDAGMWRQVRDVAMTKNRNGVWEATVDLPEDEDSTLNMCFRDNAFNWDNNNGANWVYEIHNGRMVRGSL